MDYLLHPLCPSSIPRQVLRHATYPSVSCDVPSHPPSLPRLPAGPYEHLRILRSLIFPHRWANFAWEILFALVVPTSVAQVVAFGPWLVIDIFIIYTTLKFGPALWQHSPLVAKNLGLLMASGIFFTLALFWSIIKTIGVDDSSFFIAYGVQLLISSFSVAHLVKRSSTSGHSWGIWSVHLFAYQSRSV